MVNPAPSSLDSTVRRLVAEAWAFRWQVELDAAARFERLSRLLASVGASPQICAALAQAGADEIRHAGHCERLARSYGSEFQPQLPVTVEEIAPASFSLEDRVLYEVVAASCVTETLSVAVLGQLLSGGPRGEMASVLRELMRDEVTHAQMGWAYLAEVRQRRSLTAVAEWVPWMIRGHASEELFRPPREEEKDPRLPLHGVLPWAEKRRVFDEALIQVVFPGLEHFGIDSRPSAQWLGGQTKPPQT